MSVRAPAFVVTVSALAGCTPASTAPQNVEPAPTAPATAPTGTEAVVEPSFAVDEGLELIAHERRKRRSEAVLDGGVERAEFVAHDGVQSSAFRLAPSP
jgi:hypothetical protein